jgi:hypothetical protein
VTDSHEFSHHDNAEKPSQLAGSVSFVELKALAEKLLPHDSSLHMLIMSEPNALPREIALAKVIMFSRLLHKEIST